MAIILLIPVELLGEIAGHVAQQSGLDLLSFSRTCSGFRKAARRAGRADLDKYAIVSDEDRDFSELNKREPAPILQSCIQPLPDLDFPVTRHAAPPSGSEDANQSVKGLILLHTFTKRLECYSTFESTYAFESSVFLRNIHQQSIELWDLLDYPPKVVELHMSRRILRASVSNDGCDSQDQEDAGTASAPLLQTMSLNQVRVVLVQTPAECTFHLIDAHGQPYLASVIRASALQGPAIGKTTSTAPDDSGASTGAVEITRGTEAPSCVSGTKCDSPIFREIETSCWRATRIPRCHMDDKEPGILFFSLAKKGTLLDWALLLASPDHRSSETTIFGQVDLAWMVAADLTELLIRELEVQVLRIETADPGLVVQMFWREFSKSPDDGDLLLDQPYDVRLVHAALDHLPDLSRKVESARFKVASAAIRTRSTPQILPPPPHELVQLSNDGLKLRAILPSPKDDKSFMLSMFERADIQETWDPRATAAVPLGGHGRMLGMANESLVLADDTKSSVLILSPASSPAPSRVLFELPQEDSAPSEERPSASPPSADEAAEPPSGLAQAVQPTTEGKGDVSIFLKAGRVMFTSDDGVVVAIIELNTDQQPYLVDLPALTQMCYDRLDSQRDDVLLPRQSPRHQDPQIEAPTTAEVTSGRSTDTGAGESTGTLREDTDDEDGDESEDELEGQCFCQTEIGPLSATHMRLSANDVARSMAQAGTGDTTPLVVRVRTATFYEDADDDDISPMWKYHALVLRPGRAGVRVAFCGFTFRHEYSPSPGMTINAAVDDIMAINHFDEDFDQFRDNPSERLIVNHRTGEMQDLPFATSALLGRYSNDCTSALLLRASAASQQQRLIFFHVNAMGTIGDDGEQSGEPKLYQEIRDGVNEEITDRYGASTLDWGKDRPLPNWISGKNGAYFIGGFKRLLAFLTTPEASV